MTPAISLAFIVLASTLLHPGAAATGATFVAATDSRSCSGVCSAQGLTSATMRAFNSPLQTSVCAAEVAGKGQLSGYQLGGNSTCNVVSSGKATAVRDYSCLCLASQAQAGLVRVDDNADCSRACDQGFDDLKGSAVATASQERSYTCLPSSEIGKSNRFGFTTQLDSGAICTAALNGTAAASSRFSCFCAFSSSQSSDASPPPPSSSSPLSSAASGLSQDGDAVAAGGR